MENVTINNNIDVNENDDRYPEFEMLVKEYFKSQLGNKLPLFTTNASNLFDAYLNHIPETHRQHYNCNCCRHFIERYGSLVTIDKDGNMKSALWDETHIPPLFSNSVKAMKDTVLKSKVKDVFLSAVQVLGTPTAGNWSHLSVSLQYSDPHFYADYKDMNKVIAQKREDYKLLIASIIEYNINTVKQAVSLLKTDSLYRSEKCLGIAEWFLQLKTNYEAIKNDKQFKNSLWYAVATAPAGFCHVKSSMIGTLLDDIQAGMELESIKRRFAEKMNPLQYQRPQVDPTSGNIAQAEKIVEKLGIQKSLKRRFANLDELETIWKSKEPDANESQPTGVFSHLKPKDKKETHPDLIGKVTITWVKFLDTVLPNAKTIEYYVSMLNKNFAALVTATEKDAPPIIQWDNIEDRNPVSLYFKQNSNASDWNMPIGYNKVNAICYKPNMWHNGGDKFAHFGKGVFFVLDGCKDTENHSLALFPEILISELREIRSTIEAFSRNDNLENYENASACGVLFCDGQPWNNEFKVTTDLGTTIYTIDRWD